MASDEFQRVALSVTTSLQLVELLDTLARPLYPVDSVVKFTYWAFRSPEPNIVLNFLLGLAVLFERIGVCSEQNRSSDEVDNMATTPQTPLLLIKA
ncbi:hypothetical protein BM221_007259 [Beauveria bassiana]|uniref:Uncharacterized protein n=1 Tax=Beauveria bassiana TaxID=176275 RepID=A0A2N6NJY9_BEABA|nr:hypothetical protein BM221_007252 [Beauveria bassiana]PMB67589.1 hypothetical protein BM221_007259 [Beauveria bassiana]